MRKLYCVIYKLDFNYMKFFKATDRRLGWYKSMKLLLFMLVAGMIIYC